MSDNEYERFEITDNDLANEFNPNRPRRRQTKNQQIYGIWADDSENESGDEPYSRRRRRGLGGGGKISKDYTAPVSFIAGEVQQAGKKKAQELENEFELEISDDEDEADARPAFGRKQPQIMDLDGESDEDSSDEEKPAKEQSASSKTASSFVHKSHVPSGKNVGVWEQHTRGIGAKLLLQMGYEPGKGLGKDLQGISLPVEVHVRKGRGAIGAYGPEIAASVGGKGHKPKIEDDEREVKESKDQQTKWKKGGADVRRDKPKRYYYKSVEEVIKKGQKSNYLLSEKISKKLVDVPVIDMTGPERRVLSGYHALGQKQVVDEDLYDFEINSTKKNTSASNVTSVGFSLPELTHNLQLIVDRCEQDIIALDKIERESSDRQSSLEHELDNLEEIVKLEGNHLNTLEKALEHVDELCSAENKLTLQRAEQLFLELQQHFASEYKEFGVGDLAGGVIAPLVKIALTEWKPLEQPTKHIELIKKWRTILDTSNELQTTTRNVFDPYSSLIWAGVIPSFRACAADGWNPKQHHTMAALLDAWAPLFPTWILDSVLEQLILPRLTAGVREWDPLTDTVPIHIWILPWNLILGEKMEESIFPTIREKLGAALKSWMPEDRSARAMLTPWKGAFSEPELQMFFIQHIIPKLQMVLNEFIINPLQQDFELWYQVWEWHELIQPMLMAQMLDKYFFPRWMQVLVLWLNQSPDYAEISRWYTGWKTMFTEDILREPMVKEHMRRALEIMHRATDTLTGTGTTPTGIPLVITTNIANTRAPPPPPAPPLMLDIAAPAQLEFKELVSQKCAELGILFAPLPGRREVGKQIYRVGKMYCYIDRNVCMISDGSFKNWMPTPLTQLLDRARSGVI